MEEKENIGSIGWIDLTVNNAEEVRDFYSKVIGWKSENVPMGDYFD
ncbi:MAG: glyoxalase, partial [Ignavibacteriales bacterium CG_4_9_14_3_um_filter_34_10]